MSNKTKAELAGEIFGNLLLNVGSSYWLIFAINTLFNKDMHYDFPHLASSYFFVQLFERMTSGIKK